jgi:periplasmic protein TonB
MPSVSSEVREPRRTPMRVARPLAWSLAIHLGLGGIVVLAGSAGPAPAPRAVWLDLQPVVAPAPPTPAPPAPVTRPRPVRPPIAAPREAPVPVPPAMPEEPAAPPQPPPPPRHEVATPEPPIQSAPISPQTSSAEASKAPEPDRSGAPSSRGAVSASSAVDAPSSGGPHERATGGSGNPAVASRTPEVPAGGPIVRAARPRGGYQVRPVYPDAARRAGIQGTTLLRIHIEVDGRVGDVTVARSAGHQALDEAAAEAVRRWRFEPALSSAGPVSMWAVVPVEFRISDRD